MPRVRTKPAANGEPPKASAAERTQPLFDDPVHQPPTKQLEVPAGAVVEGGRVLCASCRSMLSTTAVGYFFPCGHDRRPAVPPSTHDPRTSPPVATETHAAHHRKEHAPPASGTVTATWGEELYTPYQFHAYRVGPFTATVPLLEGETVSQGHARLMDELEEVAARERARKRASYEAELRAVGIQSVTPFHSGAAKA